MRRIGLIGVALFWLAGCNMDVGPSQTPTAGAKSDADAPSLSSDGPAKAPQRAAPAAILSADRVSGTIGRTAFAQMVRDATISSPATRARAAALNAASTRVDAQRSVWRPQASLGASAVTGQSRIVPVGRITQLLYDGGANRSNVTIAKLGALQAFQSQLSEMATQTYTNVEAVIALRQARERSRQADRNLAQVQDVVSDLRRRFDAGSGSSADLLAGEGRVAQAQSQQLEAQADMREAEAIWSDLFERPAPVRLPDIPDAPRLKSNDIDVALSSSPRLQELDLERAAYEEAIELAKAQGRPRVSAIVESDFGAGTIRNDVQARLGLDVPIYKGGQFRASIAGAEADLAQTVAAQEGVRRDLRRALTSAFSEIATTKQRTQAAKRAVSVNSEALDAAKGQFQLGKGSLLAILDAQRAINETELTLIDLRAETSRAQYAILAITGDIIAALGIVVPSEPLFPVQPLLGRGDK